MPRITRSLSLWLILSVALGCGGSSTKPATDGGSPGAGDGGNRVVDAGMDDASQTMGDASTQDAGADAGPVAVTFSVGGTISGLSANGLVLQNNGGDDLAVAAGKVKFKFQTELVNEAAYTVTVKQQPAGLECVVTLGHGKITNAKVKDVAVTCSVPPINLWTWLGGTTSTDAVATYGTQGTGAPANNPGARYAAASWTGANDTLWLFGGTPDGGSSALNDLWSFDGTKWTWVMGDSNTNAQGTYGTKGTGSANNTPGARFFACSRKDSAGSFWLFGGRGYDTAGTEGTLSDLWKFDGTKWIWVAGSDTVDIQPVYGTKGMPAALNTPGGRSRAVAWIDSADNFWLFGGRNAAGNQLNDLWKFDGSQWTWIAGDSTPNSAGVFGSAANEPGARQDSVAWIDAHDNLWLYGGYGYDGFGTQSELNEMWKFNGTKWIEMSGSNQGNFPAAYGTLGVTVPGNDPGGREDAVGWVDAQGNMWLFGGTSGHDVNELNDLWKFDGQFWTWVAGADTADSLGVYGTKGSAKATNLPGARDSAIVWRTASGELRMFGGWGFGASGTASNLNDFWRYQP